MQFRQIENQKVQVLQAPALGSKFNINGAFVEVLRVSPVSSVGLYQLTYRVPATKYKNGLVKNPARVMQEIFSVIP